MAAKVRRAVRRLSPDARRAEAHFFRYREAHILNVIEREWAADGMLGTDTFIALARLRDERRVGLDWRPLERLAERASTNRDVHSTNLPGTHAGKAEAVGRLAAQAEIRRAHLCRRRALPGRPAPIVDRLRNVPVECIQ